MIVNLVGNSIEVKNGASGSPEYFNLADIASLFPLYIPASVGGSFGTGYPDIYPYPSRTEITITFTDSYGKPPLKIELQKITAGPLFIYSTGTKADLDNATALINSWL